jgi:hypothetical protein
LHHRPHHIPRDVPTFASNRRRLHPAVVGGPREFVGSDSNRVNHEITKENSTTSKVTLSTA